MSLQPLLAAKLQVSPGIIGQIDSLFIAHTKRGDLDEVVVDATTFHPDNEGMKDLSEIVEVPPRELAGKLLLFYV